MTSPDGLGERLRDEAKVRESADYPAGTRLAHEATLFRQAADRIDTLTEQLDTLKTERDHLLGEHYLAFGGCPRCVPTNA